MRRLRSLATVLSLMYDSNVMSTLPGMPELYNRSLAFQWFSVYKNVIQQRYMSQFDADV